MLAVLLACTMILPGCAGTGSSADSSKTASSASSAASSSAASKSSTASAQTSSAATPQGTAGTAGTTGSGAASSKDTKVEAVIYVSNSDASAFEKKTVTLDKLTPQNLIDALISNKAVPEETSVLSMQKEQADDGTTRLTLDLSDQFQKGLDNTGSSGEYWMVGSVVNTFLDAYSASGVRITIAGNTLESPGAGEMTGYLRQYK